METEIIDGNPPTQFVVSELNHSTSYECVLCLEVDEVDPVMYCCFFFLLLVSCAQIMNINVVSVFLSVDLYIC